MSVLLTTFADIALPILVLIAGLGVGVLIIVVGRKKFRTNADKNFRSIDAKDVSVTPAGKYCEEDIMKFLDNLHMALPEAFIAFPKVGVDQLVVPGKNRIAYNAIMSKYVDVAVFYRKTMQPVLVIDLVNPNGSTETSATMDKDVVSVLDAIKLPVVQVKLEKAYNLETLRHSLIHSIPDKILAEINFSLKG